MPIFIEHHSVIIPKEVLKVKFKGGLEAYKRSSPNQSFEEDEYLTRVGFMNLKDLEMYLDDIFSKGLEYDNLNKRSDDLTIISPFRISWEVNWLKYEYPYCWHVK